MTKKLFLVFAIFALLMLPFSVGAYGEQYGGAGENYTVPNVSVNVFTILPLSAMDVAYPQELFYAILFVAGICLLLDIMFFASRDGVPVMASIITSVVGFGLFLACAAMSPLVARFSVVVTDTQIINVATYLFSPWVAYACSGMASLMLVLLFYAVILSFKMVKRRKEEAERRKEQDFLEGIL